MLTKLALWYLRKRKVSVILGFQISSGSVQQVNRTSYLFDNKFINVKYLNCSGNEVLLLGGEFSMKWRTNNESTKLN